VAPGRRRTRWPGESAATPAAGTWNIAPGSVVGYRVKEVLFGQNHVPNPSFTGFVTTQNHGVLEFLLKLARS
jgi:hypothetical protein